MTKKIDEKRWGKPMQGTLMLFERTLGGKEKSHSIGNFVSNLTRYGRGVDDLARSMYYFVPSGKYGGGGTLSNAMAVHAVGYIKESMRAGGNNPKYKGPVMKPLSDEGRHGGYATWKSKVSNFRGSPLMMLTGAMADSIGMKKGVGGRTVVTVNMDFLGPPAAPGVAGVKVGSYVNVHERGTGGKTGTIPGRPIITGSMLGWIATQSDSWRVAFQRLMKETVWVQGGRGSKEDLAEDIVPAGSSSNSAIDVLANINRQAEVLETLAKKVSSTARNLLVATARGAKGHTYSGDQRARAKAILVAELTGSGYSSEKISEIAEIALGGRIPNEYLFD